MCDNLDQAIARSGAPGSKEDKGYDAAVAAIAFL
jgi:6,7-dimethyl-8-ribityllumazine synthase